MHNFEAGYLAEYGPADITIFDDKADRIVDTHFASKSSNSPLVAGTILENLKMGNSNVTYDECCDALGQRLQ